MSYTSKRSLADDLLRDIYESAYNIGMQSATARSVLGDTQWDFRETRYRDGQRLHYGEAIEVELSDTTRQNSTGLEVYREEKS